MEFVSFPPITYIAACQTYWLYQWRQSGQNVEIFKKDPFESRVEMNRELRCG